MRSMFFSLKSQHDQLRHWLKADDDDDDDRVISTRTSWENLEESISEEFAMFQESVSEKYNFGEPGLRDFSQINYLL